MYGFIKYNDKRNESQSLKEICINGLLSIFFMLYGFIGYGTIFAGLIYISIKEKWNPMIVASVVFIMLAILLIIGIIMGIKSIIKTLNKQEDVEGSSKIQEE